MRFLRLGMGISMMVQSVQMHDKLIGAIAIILLYQALFNKGCCAANACASPMPKQTSNSTEEINFEEVK